MVYLTIGTYDCDGGIDAVQNRVCVSPARDGQLQELAKVVAESEAFAAAAGSRVKSAAEDALETSRAKWNTAVHLAVLESIREGWYGGRVNLPEAEDVYCRTEARPSAHA